MSEPSYLGDGVYASFDGWMIWLETPRQVPHHRIALEPEVFQALLKFERSLRTVSNEKVAEELASSPASDQGMERTPGSGEEVSEVQPGGVPQAGVDEEVIIPICQGCGKAAHDLPEYIEYGKIEEMSPDDYVKKEEGTYNPENGHFLCTPCYVKAGMPSSPRGWTCP